MPASQPQPQPQPHVVQVQRAVAVPDYVVAARKADSATLSAVEKNPIYQYIFAGSDTFEQRIAKVKEYLLAGIEDGSATIETLDQRRQQLRELNAAIQVIRKQLGSEQAEAICSKAYADFQRIVNVTSDDVATFQAELAPLCELGELFEKYGADGNIIEKINLAKEQKRQREQHLIEWSAKHDAEVLAYRQSVAQLRAQIKTDSDALDTKWFHKAALEARIANAKRDLEEREKQLADVLAKTPEESQSDDVEQVDEHILELQNIGGQPFKTAVTDLHRHTEEALAKISTNFDEAVTGLTNAREAFIAMDRNCGDATFALSVLEVGVQQAESASRAIAEGIVADDDGATDAMANLKRMEREQRSQQLLEYTAALTTFLKDLNFGMSSLRKGQTVIKSVLRMNAMALESANTHKITGIANTADAVTITIGSIIDVCNRAASRVLEDGLIKMRGLAEEGSARLIGGAYEALAQQNEQLQEFVGSVGHLREMTHEISVNTIGMLKEQFRLVEEMRARSMELANANTEAERTMFAARAGVTPEQKQDDQPQPTERRGFAMRIPHE